MEIYHQILEMDREFLEELPVSTVFQLGLKWQTSKAFDTAWSKIVDIMVLKKSVMTDEVTRCFWHSCIHMTISLEKDSSIILTLFRSVE
jgi:hypothetical protein